MTRGLHILGATVPIGVPIFEDRATVRLVQAAIMALPQYETDAALSLDRDDGLLTVQTAAAIAHLNALRGAPEEHITEGLLDYLHITPVAAPSGAVPTVKRDGKRGWIVGGIVAAGALIVGTIAHAMLTGTR